MIKREGQICFAAAEIDDFQGLVLRQVWEDILHDFKVTVNLTEFVVAAREYGSVFAHNPKADQKITGNARRQYIIFCAVVGQGGCGHSRDGGRSRRSRHCQGLAGNPRCFRFCGENLNFTVPGKNIRLLEFLTDQVQRKAACIGCIEIGMCYFLRISIFRLVF